MITIKDLLNASAFQKSEILAGSDGLTRQVTTITVAEVPDSANWLRGGELVCTTAFFMSNQVIHQSEWINSLIKNGASALAIKTSRFLGVIPSEIIEVANKNSFSIISLPHEITWPIVIESFMDFFMNERMKVMKLVEEVQSNLINLVLDDHSIQTITNKVANLIGNPIILEDAQLKVISIGKDDVSDDDHFQSIITKRLEDSFKEKILKSKFYQNIQKGISEEKLEVVIKSHKHNRTPSITIPVVSNKSLYGFITLLEYNKPHTLIDLIVLRNATSVVALKLMKHYVNEHTRREKNLALIEDIIHGRIHTQVIYEYDFLNINWSHPMLAVMIEFEQRTNSTENNVWDRSEELIYKVTKSRLEIRFGQVILGNNGLLFTLLIPFSPELINGLAIEVRKELEQLSLVLGGYKFHIGVGGIYSNPKLIGKSYNEAKTALAILKKFKRNAPILFYEEIGVHRILSMVNDFEKIKEFCDDFLLDIKEYSTEKGNELLDTLHNYLLCDCNIKKTAQKLFVHPNTVSYRIKKIKQIIKYDLDSFEFKIAYLLALEFNLIINN